MNPAKIQSMMQREQAILSKALKAEKAAVAKYIDDEAGHSDDDGSSDEEWADVYGDGANCIDDEAQPADPPGMHAALLEETRQRADGKHTPKKSEAAARHKRVAIRIEASDDDDDEDEVAAAETAPAAAPELPTPATAVTQKKAPQQAEAPQADAPATAPMEVEEDEEVQEDDDSDQDQPAKVITPAPPSPVKTASQAPQEPTEEESEDIEETAGDEDSEENEDACSDDNDASSDEDVRTVDSGSDDDDGTANSDSDSPADDESDEGGVMELGAKPSKQEAPAARRKARTPIKHGAPPRKPVALNRKAPPRPVSENPPPAPNDFDYSLLRKPLRNPEGDRRLLKRNCYNVLYEHTPVYQDRTGIVRYKGTEYTAIPNQKIRALNWDKKPQENVQYASRFKFPNFVHFENVNDPSDVLTAICTRSNTKNGAEFVFLSARDTRIFMLLAIRNAALPREDRTEFGSAHGATSVNFKEVRAHGNWRVSGSGKVPIIPAQVWRANYRKQNPAAPRTKTPSKKVATPSVHFKEAVAPATAPVEAPTATAPTNASGHFAVIAGELTRRRRANRRSFHEWLQVFERIHSSCDTWAQLSDRVTVLPDGMDGDDVVLGALVCTSPPLLLLAHRLDEIPDEPLGAAVATPDPSPFAGKRSPKRAPKRKYAQKAAAPAIKKKRKRVRQQKAASR